MQRAALVAPFLAIAGGLLAFAALVPSGGPPPGSRSRIAEVVAVAASVAPPLPQPANADEFLALGDSLMNQAFESPDQQPLGWQTAWLAANHRPGPRAYNAGHNGDTAADGLARVDAELARRPKARYVGIAFGTNDCAHKRPVAAYAADLRRIAERVRLGGRVPLLATVTYSARLTAMGLDAYSEAARAVRAEAGMRPGPDLYAFGQAHPQLYGPDGIHFTKKGVAVFAGLWADTVARELGGKGERR